MEDRVFIGGGGDNYGLPQSLLLKRANRHGLVAGATGTGKTVTLQILAQGLSDAGVPVFAADVKGDLSGLAMAGSETHKLHDKFLARCAKIGMNGLDYAAAPTIFWDLFHAKGHPVRATVSEMGPLLLSRLLDLNETQEGVLTIAFQIADDNKMLLLDLKDLRALLVFVAEQRDEIGIEYGNVSPASVGAIQRRLLVLEREGADKFFGEPALELHDFMRTTPDGRGYINIMDVTDLMSSPRVYATFLLWLLSELFEQLPEVGDPDKPKLVFFFDEAHLLFDDAPKALIDKIEQVVKLIRSKGVGVFFVTQNPRDIPENVLAQLGSRIQHALRAYTPSERRAVKAAADSFRPNPAFDTEETITQLGVGEALVSTLDDRGAPTMVERTLIRPPSSRMGPLTDAERRDVIQASPVAGRYDTTVDRESAYEILEKRRVEEAERARQEAERAAAMQAREEELKLREKEAKSKRKRSSGRQTVAEAAMKTAVRTASNRIVNALIRGILGGRR